MPPERARRPKCAHLRDEARRAGERRYPSTTPAIGSQPKSARARSGRRRRGCRGEGNRQRRRRGAVRPPRAMPAADGCDRRRSTRPGWGERCRPRSWGALRGRSLANTSGTLAMGRTLRCSPRRFRVPSYLNRTHVGRSLRAAPSSVPAPPLSVTFVPRRTTFSNLLSSFK